MSAEPYQSSLNKLSLGGVLVSFGIIYGDIGTSPIYTLRFIVGSHVITEDLVLGGLSCILWTLAIITTLKYVVLALNADNKGEGGIFALYALVRKYKVAWIIIPAMIGCCTLIADGFITPAISVTSAVEGLRRLSPDITANAIVLIVLAILAVLFVFQQFGSSTVGKAFGPVMLAWFIFIGFFGAYNLASNPKILWAVNPMYAIRLLIEYPGGFWILGAVFLCTTGAEAMYSDLGHCGKNNIRMGWTFVLVSLLLSYFGQGVYLLSRAGKAIGSEEIPFFEMIPQPFMIFAVVIATLATVTASQALISGTFTLVNEAMKFRLWPSTRVRYPSRAKGQVYLPAINWLLMLGSSAVVFFFKDSSAMEAAYGLAITVNMLMTTLLLVYYYWVGHHSRVRSVAMAVLFVLIEGAFLASNLSKFHHGGWFTFGIAFVFFTMMFTLRKARRMRDRHTDFVSLKEFIPTLKEMQNDLAVPKEASNLVYLAKADSKRFIDSTIIYSIFKKRPKRADTYWFIHIDTVDSPFTSKYSVDTIIPQKCFFVRIKLGFKADHRVNIIFNSILRDMEEAGEVNLISPYPSPQRHKVPADFKFIIINSIASINSEMSAFDNLIIQFYRLIKKRSLPPQEKFGLELANVEVEQVPILVGPAAKVRIKRVHEDRELEKELKYANLNRPS